MIITDLRQINPINNPKWVFTTTDEIASEAIELSEDGSWGLPWEVSHMMSMTLPGVFNCQSPDGFNQVPVTNYMKAGTKVILFDCMNMTPQIYQALCMIVQERLGKQGYDWLQIVGQAIGLDFLHMPGTEDCSEEGVREMKGIAPFFNDDEELETINSLSNQSNPQQVLEFQLFNIVYFTLSGFYDSAKGVVV